MAISKSMREQVENFRSNQGALQLAAAQAFARMEMDCLVAEHMSGKLDDLTKAIDNLATAEQNGSTKMGELTKAYKNATVWIAVFTGALVLAAVAQIVVTLSTRL